MRHQRAGGREPPPPLLGAAGLAVAALAVLPLAYLLVRALGDGLPDLAGVLFEGRTGSLLAHTAGLTAAVTAAAVVLAVPLAWLTVRSDLPGRRVFAVLTALPLAVPSYVGGYAFVAAFGPRGLVQGWLEPFGVDRLPSLYGFWGAFLVLTFSTYPYVLLTVRAALAGLDPALEEAGRSLGRSSLATFFSVVLPQLRPSIGAGALLVALYSLHDFGAVNMLKFDSFTRAIYQQYQSAFDPARAAALGLVLVALTVAVLSVEAGARGRIGVPRARGRGQARVVLLGAWRWPATVTSGAVVALGLGLPLGIISYWLFRGGAAGESLRLTAVLAGRSLQVAAVGAAMAVLAAGPVAVLAARHPGRLARLVERGSFVGYALPGIVVALSLVFFGTRVVPALYQTRTMLVGAYVILFLPQAVGALRASLLQISPSLEEAARSLGCERRGVWWRVMLPLVRPGLVAGFGLVFLTAMKELPATLLLAPIEFTTLATQVWGATSEALFARAAAPALAIVALSALPLLLPGRVRRRLGPPGAQNPGAAPETSARPLSELRAS